MSFTLTTAYTWVDGEVCTAVKLNATGAPTIADGQTYTFGVGAAATPSINFTGATTTGLYYAASKIGVAISGVKALDIASTGLAVTGIITASTQMAVGGAIRTDSAFNLVGTLNTSSGAGYCAVFNNTITAQANSDAAAVLNVAGTLATGTYTGLTHYGAYISGPTLTGSGSLTESTLLRLGSAASATNKYGIYQAGTDQNYLNGQLVAKGTATNDSAPAGFIGEYVESIITTGSEVSLTTSVPANLTSISLTAGDWDITGSVFLELNAATVLANALFGFNTTSATLPAIDSSKRAHFTWNNTNNWVGTPYATMPTCRFSLSTTTTIYFVCYGNFSTNTLAVFGSIRARRFR